MEKETWGLEKRSREKKWKKGLKKTKIYAITILIDLIQLIRLRQIIQFAERGVKTMFVLDYRDRRPIYEQLTDRLKESIVRGIWSEDEQLPSVRSLAVDLSINPNTIQRAYAELERQGFIYSVKGKGSFVAQRDGIRKMKERELSEKAAEFVQDGCAAGFSLGELVQMVQDAFAVCEEAEGGRKV